MRRTSERRLAPILTVVALVAATAALQEATATPAGAQPAAAIDWGDPVAPPGTPRVGDAPGGTAMPVLFGFTHDAAGLAQLAAAVSDPRGPAYGRYSPVAELARRFGVGAADRAAFVAGATAAGMAPEVDATGAFAAPNPTVDQLEALLGVTFGVYQVTEGSTTVEVIAPDALPASTPAALAGVEVVRGLDMALPTPPGPPMPPHPPPPTPTPTGDYPADGGTPTRTGTAAGCADALAVTNPAFPGEPGGLAPNQLHAAYGLDAAHAAGLRGQGTRVALVEAGPFRQADLDTFTACFGVDATTPTIHGSQPESAAGVEATLDIQVLSLLVPEADRIDVFQNPLDDNWQLAPFLSAPLDVSETGGLLPHVVSVSYGVCEPFLTDVEVELSEFVLATAAAAGVSYHLAAGDSGSSACYHNDGVTTTQSVGYPGSSAWVTTVGGTNLTLTGDNRIAGQGVWNDTAYFEPPQTAATLGAGTGGTSSLIPRPAWQQGEGVPAGTARTVPDVALYADSLAGWIIYCTIPDVGFCPTGGWTTVGGTSAATPLFAGIAALTTQAALAAGQPRLGFASPLLYELASDAPARADVFRDVVLGGNDLFGVGCCSATPAYDTASGWGSVDAGRLVDALAPPVVALAASPAAGAAPATVTFSAAGSSAPAGEIVAFHWDLDGDGVADERTTGPTLTTTFTEAGTARVAVSAATSLGRSATVALGYEVRPAGTGGPVVPPRFTG